MVSCTFKFQSMKTYKILILFLFGILLVGCAEEKSLEDFMVGSWQTTHLEIKMPTYQMSDSTYTFVDKFDNNPELIAQSKYNNDGTFSAWFINKEGEKINNSDGTWKVENDSLFVEFFYNNTTTKASYKIEETEEGFVGKSKYDWDDDGEIDDFLTMKTKRLKTE